MTARLLLVLTLVWWPLFCVAAKPPAGKVAQVDARTEVAAALYAASATQAAAQRASDAKIRAHYFPGMDVDGLPLAGALPAELRACLTANARLRAAAADAGAPTESK